MQRVDLVLVAAHKFPCCDRPIEPQPPFQQDRYSTTCLLDEASMRISSGSYMCKVWVCVELVHNTHGM